MNKLITDLYRFLHHHPLVTWGMFLGSTVLLISSFFTLHYKEDISDFLPMDEANATVLSVYQDVSGANNIYVIVSTPGETGTDPQQLTDGIDALVAYIQEADTVGLVAEITAQVDMERIMDVTDRVYADIPLFLTDADYARMDSLLAVPDYIARCVAEDKEMLLLPSSQMLVHNLGRDPLDLFSPVLRRLSSPGIPMEYATTGDGYILSPDMTKAIAVIRSSSGASESDANARLLSLLEEAAAGVRDDNPGLDVHIIGGPAIAVANAGRIRMDSLLAISLSGMLILALLAYVFRNALNILLILVSVAWGWLFAMGGMALLCHSVSVIVIGIASVILGIAVNYPLHLIDHMRHGNDGPLASLREIISPLVIGNVTTVGAFLCLVPLDAPALHDLGLFSALLLVGTILFVLVFLPHAVRTRAGGNGAAAPGPTLLSRLAAISVERHRGVVPVVLLLTCVFGYYSLSTEFDTDMRNINYMTEEQRADLEYFNDIFSRSKDTETAYLVSSGRDWQTALSQNGKADAVLDSLQEAGLLCRNGSVSSFLTSREVQAGRLARWQRFLDRHVAALLAQLDEAARREGFAPTAFDPFREILHAGYGTHDLEYFDGLTTTVFARNVSDDARTGRKSVVQTMELRPEDMERVKQAVERTEGFDGMLFDVRGMNEAMASTLSDNFNYIGLACGCIVFLFLWLSFGNAELALASFVPMAVSWVWILGIMSLLDIRFNIVNVILATFIFGQGDDYTIFMTEGLSYEYAYRRRLLPSYKGSIIVSALIMFIGMGTLVFARHPALRSLGEVIVVGMFSVVLMAYIFPPLIFDWLVRSHGQQRPRPMTIGRLLRTACATVMLYLTAGILWGIGKVMFCSGDGTTERRRRYRVCVSSLLRFFFRSIPGVRLTLADAGIRPGEGERPPVVFCFRRSPWDCLCLMALSPQIIIVGREEDARILMFASIMRYGGHICATSVTADEVLARCPDDCSPAFDSPAEALAAATRLHRDICPVYIIGMEHVLPQGSAPVCAGPLHVGADGVMPFPVGGVPADALSQAYDSGEKRLCRRVLTLKDIIPVVFDRYRYKGRDIETAALRALRRIAANPSLLSPDAGAGALSEGGWQGRMLVERYVDDVLASCCPMDDEEILHSVK